MKKLSDVILIPSIELIEKGIHDPYIDWDVPLYIHPRLFERCTVPEFIKANEKIETFFHGLIGLIKLSNEDNENDKFYKDALRIFSFPEKDIKGLHFGTAKVRPYGTGFTGSTAHEALSTIYKIVKSGVEDSSILRLLSVFQEGVGVDRISDMIISIVYECVLAYSERIFNEFHVKGRKDFPYGKSVYSLLFSEKDIPILTVPTSILSEIPIALSRDEIDYVVSENHMIRRLMDDRFMRSYEDYENAKKEYDEYSKAKLLEIALRYKEVLDGLLSREKTQQITPYDFFRDKKGLYETVNGQPYYQLLLQFSPSIHNEGETLLQTILILVKDFKFLLENKNVKTLLYNPDNTVKREVDAHMLFLTVAYMAKKTARWDYSFEPNCGHGSVEFRFSFNHEVVVVEFKLSTHDKLIHGYQRQLQDYMNNEETPFGIYVIVEVEGGHKVDKVIEELSPISPNKPIIRINAIRSLSSSRL